jgi:hypothetical protein
MNTPTLPEGRKPLTDADMADLTRRLAGTAVEQSELYQAALHDAKEAEAYAAELEVKLASTESDLAATIKMLQASRQRNERLDAELAAADAAQAWQPIETAPEWEAVLICGGDVLYPCVASCNNGEWDAEAQGMILREDIAENPTHWMPLPAPPKETK